MKRRSLLLAGLAAPLLPVATANAAPQLTIVNVSAQDCLYCILWTQQHKPAWLESPLYKQVRYVEIQANTIKRAYASEYWTGEIKPVLDQVPRKNGTPRFLLVRDGRIVVNEFGVSGWTRLLDELKAKHLA
jgi:hypothetical protein